MLRHISLQYYFTTLLETGCMFWNIFYSIQASFFSFCQFGSYCGVATMLLIRQCSPITSIKLLQSHYWPHGEIPERFLSYPATELGTMPVSL